ncbi:unnamed protein product [Penicillium roqueforti FM164]|uniref:Uncharacterized protein n=1 Tax=Penicillium roqueforti (strain FM164) TaxID=1365484 RepID=W6QQF0_PENRF|nr:unnamed protein product [Penicillium roqueforti FM164]
MLAADFDGRHLIFKLAENGRTIYRSPEIIRLSERPNEPRATSAQYHLCKTLNDRLPFIFRCSSTTFALAPRNPSAYLWLRRVRMTTWWNLWRYLHLSKTSTLRLAKMISL